LSLALRPLAIEAHPRPLPIDTGFIQHSRRQLSLGYTPDKGAWVHQGQHYHSANQLSEDQQNRVGFEMPIYQTLIGESNCAIPLPPEADSFSRSTAMMTAEQSGSEV